MRAQTAQKTQKLTLKGYYDSLPKNQFVTFRDMVIEKCKVSQPTFYVWLNRPQSIPPVYHGIINEITGVELNYSQEEI